MRGYHERSTFGGGTQNVKRLLLGACLLCAVWPAPAALYGQEGRLAVVVEYIAGTDIYLRAGIEQGLSVNDTISVRGGVNGTLLGTLRVVSVTRERSVVTFAGEPFPVTRGQVLQLEVLTGGVGRTEPGRVEEQLAEAPLRRRSRIDHPLHVDGRLALGVDMLESSTHPGGQNPTSVDRRFTTPALHLRMTVSNLPGGLRLNGNVRASSRYSAGSSVEPRHSLRIYRASLEKSFETVPLHLQLGRFYSPYETFSGYWDGMLLRVGGRGPGVGFAVGYEPDRSNEDFTTDLPKYTAFLDYRHRGDGVRYEGDLSFTQIKPRSEMSDHRYLGLGQNLYLGRFSVSQRLQVDLDPINDRWTVTHFDLRSSIPLGGLSILAAYSNRRPFYIFRPEDPISDRRERATLGATVFLPGGTLGGDVTANRWGDEEISLSYGSRFNIPKTALLGLGFSGSVTYWRQEDVETLYLAPGISRAFGLVRCAFSFQRYSTWTASTPTLSDALDGSLTFPIARRLFALLQGRVQWGDVLTSNSFYTGLWMSF